MKIEVTGRVIEVAESEADKVFVRLQTDNDSEGWALVRVEQPARSGGVSVKGLAIGHRVRITVESDDA